MKYSVETTKTVRMNHGEKNHRNATTFSWTTFNCWFETSSDKLQNVCQ